ncbi:hypothetical protein DEU56DRAFT_763458 [Suillus clintonianus]|uniref:uncharacterized protein n=1 Tax=Suillus clintonianus TaxID=1904413 RepID=UPI001B883BEB|nr:uncharacterized protein DEU56DRAFT_763458 [Suillus clintonianus]KAG2157204.1 hypothetical protein DEU56DRAFT_763458 [Suillus clintonianus]
MLSIHSTSIDLESVPTEIMIQAFADRILVLVTQMGKVGNLIQASIPSTTPLLSSDDLDEDGDSQTAGLPAPPAAIQLTPLLGGASSEHLQTLHSLYAAQIATIIWVEEAKRSMGVNRRSVVVGIALQKSRDADDERKIFLGVMDHLYRLVNQAG